jgi:hypothetical protein
MFGYVGIDGEDSIACEIVDGVMIEIDGLRCYAGLLQQAARDVENNVRFRMVDRIHEAAAIGPAQEIGAEIESELPARSSSASAAPRQTWK